MEVTPLAQLRAMVSDLAEKAAMREEDLNKTLFNAATDASHQDKDLWRQHANEAMKQTIEAGRAFFQLVIDPSLTYFARTRPPKGDRERYHAYQNSIEGVIWCYISQTRFIIGPVHTPGDYLIRITKYIDQLRAQNANLRDERVKSYHQLKSEGKQPILVQEIFPETAGPQGRLPLTNDDITKWELQINWWETLYITELKKHAEGFALAALEGGDVICAVDCLAYLDLLDVKEITFKLENYLLALSQIDSPESRQLLQIVAEHIKQIQDREQASQTPVIPPTQL